jgi:hypothetical protein
MTPPAPRLCRWAARRALAAALTLAGVARKTAAAAAIFTCGAADDAVTCAALGALYTATGGAGWSNTTGWRDAAAGTATSACTFYGVSCDGGGAVTQLCVPPHWHARARQLVSSTPLVHTSSAFGCLTRGRTSARLRSCAGTSVATSSWARSRDRSAHSQALPICARPHVRWSAALSHANAARDAMPAAVALRTGAAAPRGCALRAAARLRRVQFSSR